MGELRPFDEEIYVTRPLLPELDEFKRRLGDIWSSRQLTNNGPQHRELEATMRDFLKAPGLSLFNNGTIALIVAVQSLALKGEVITTPFTFPATPHVLTWNGITPVFCDIDAETMNIDPARIEALITPQTTAILGVHVYGTPCDVEAIDDIAKRRGLKVIYDAAHAFGVEIDGRGIGTFGDMSMFSFHATKLYHTAEGGALTFNDAALKPHVDLLKNFGIRGQESVIMPGINGKMNELQAALGLVVLAHVEQERARRKALRDVYVSELSGTEGLSIIKNDLPDIKSSYQYMVVRIDKARFGASRDEVHEAMKRYNVFTRKYFFPLCSEYDCYKSLPSASPEKLPEAVRAASEVLCLPFYGALSADDVRRICAMIKSCKGAPSA